MYCILNMGWTPSQYMELSQRERALVIASIQIKIEEEDKENRKLKSRSSTGRRR